MTTDHELHDSLGCRLRLRHFTGILPIAQNDNAVANREDFFNAMGYENYAETPFTKSADNSEECGDLGIGQSGSGFVHDYNTRVVRKRLCHLNHLLLSDAELAHGCARIEIDAE